MSQSADGTIPNPLQEHRRWTVHAILCISRWPPKSHFEVILFKILVFLWKAFFCPGRVYVKGEFGNPKCVHSGEDDADQQQKHDGQEQTRSHGHLNGKEGGGNFDGGKEEKGFTKGQIALQMDQHREGPEMGRVMRIWKGARGRGQNRVIRGRTVPCRRERRRMKVRHRLAQGERQRATRTARRRQSDKSFRCLQLIPNKILQELQRRRNGNADKAQRPIPSHLPGFGSAEQLKRWRNFLGGKPGLDGQGFRRYGSRLSPDANGECPLVSFGWYLP